MSNRQIYGETKWSEKVAQFCCVSDIGLTAHSSSQHATGTHVLHAITRHGWHSRLYPRQFKLILDLATPQEGKAELTLVIHTDVV